MFCYKYWKIDLIKLYFLQVFEEIVWVFGWKFSVRLFQTIQSASL